MKYDVAKQEINFFQSKLKDGQSFGRGSLADAALPAPCEEQRDWTEKCLAESGAVTRAAALESQALLHTRRVRFRSDDVRANVAQ